MKSSLGVMLGVIVSGLTGACGGNGQSAQPGTLKPDGTTTAGSHTVTESSCTIEDRWRFSLDASFTCEAAFDLVKEKGCEALCEEKATCYLGDDDEKLLERTACPKRPTQLLCQQSTSKSCQVEGRRTAGLREVDGDPYSSVRDYLANAAYLEGAAVFAFDRLASELAANGAPAELLWRISRAAEEERRHVVLMSRLARRYGAEPVRAQIEAMSERSLFEIARENMVEGVVRETYGAAVALFRAQRAADIRARRVFRSIAADEVRHAELSAALHEWLITKLTREERAALEDVRHAAIVELGDALRQEPHPELARDIGVPTAREAATLHARLLGAVWSEAA